MQLEPQNSDFFLDRADLYHKAGKAICLWKSKFIISNDRLLKTNKKREEGWNDEIKDLLNTLTSGWKFSKWFFLILTFIPKPVLHHSVTICIFVCVHRCWRSEICSEGAEVQVDVGQLQAHRNCLQRAPSCWWLSLHPNSQEEGAKAKDCKWPSRLYQSGDK